MPGLVPRIGLMSYSAVHYDSGSDVNEALAPAHAVSNHDR